MRHCVVRGARGRRRDPGLDRAAGARDGRLGVPLCPAPARRGHAGDRGHPVRRDGGHDRPDTLGPRPGQPHRPPRGVPRRVEDVRDPGDDAGARGRDREGRGRSGSTGAGAGRALRALPDAAARTLELNAGIADLARRYVNSRGFMFIGRGYTLPGRARGRPQAQGDQLRPRGGLCRRRAEARSDLAARRGVPAGGDRDPVTHLRQADQQRDGGPRARREGDRGGHRGRPRSSASRTTCCGSRTPTRRWPRCSRSSRSSCSPTTRRSRAARTWTSRGTSRSR